MNVRKRVLALLMCICMIFTLLPFSVFADNAENGIGGGTEEVVPDDTGDTEQSDKWNVKVSKKATDLHDGYKTEVTLSVPAEQETLTTDVVFVLDASDCVKSVVDRVKPLVDDLNNVKDENKDYIRVGVVVFKGSAAAMFGGKLVSVGEAVTALDKLIAAINAVPKKNGKPDTDRQEKVILSYANVDIKKGSNLHSGLLEAEKLLKNDVKTADNRKYLINVTDGMTYYWNDEQGNVYGVYSESATEIPNLLFYAFCEANGINQDSNKGTLYGFINGQFDWGNYLKSANDKMTADQNKYRVNLSDVADKLGKTPEEIRFVAANVLGDENNKIPFIERADKNNHAQGMDYSVAACLDTYQEMVNAGYKCYTYNPTYGEGTFPGLFTSELNKMAGVSGEVNFGAIKNDIIYAVDKDSQVSDIIDDRFDLDLESLKLTVGGKEYIGLPHYYLDELRGYNFYKQLDEEDSTYPSFSVYYDEPNKTLNWGFNEAVSNFEPVELTYTLTLKDPQTEQPGYYGQRDLNGDGYIEDNDGNKTGEKVDPNEAIYTNVNATLIYKDTNGEEGTAIFPKPSVAYEITSIPVAKTATELTKDADGNYKTDVTLSLLTRDNDTTSAVGIGTTIVDKIGKDFKLVDSDNIVINTKSEIYGSGSVDWRHIKVLGENGAWTSYYGEDRYDGSMVLGEKYYWFKLTYDGQDTLELTFNGTWGAAQVISMTYTLQLIKPETAPGTYGQLDLDGSGYIDGEDGTDTATEVDPNKALNTNNEAKLYPIDGKGNKGQTRIFPMPSVDYTVKNSYNPPVNPGIYDEIIVEITGNSDSVVYDGTEHDVKGYTVKISDPRYTEKDFTFTGKAEASGINAGTYEMGLAADQFKNINARFRNVKFVIKADGVLTITPKDLTITAGSKTDYGPNPVTCGDWTVDGLVAGDKVESVKITGSQNVPGSSANVASDAVIKNAKGEDVTKNYNIKYVDGTLTMLEVLNKEDHFNYIIGYTDGTVRPGNNITRAEVATIFFRLLTDDARANYDTKTSTFSDVADGQWYTRAIATLAKAGIVTGDPNGTFRPNDAITRAEMATIIARFGDFKDGGKTFSDISGHWAAKYIELAASNGWINGDPDGKFRPNDAITRAETVAMINRVLERQTKDVSDLLPVAQMTTWTDNMDTAAWYYRDMQEATNNHKAERVGESAYEKWTEKLPDIDWASYQI